MSGWHHQLDRPESEWTPGVGDGQGGLACCDSWGRKDSDTTERLNWTDLKLNHVSFRLLWPWQSLRLPFLCDDLDVFENCSRIMWNVSLVELSFCKEDHRDEVTFSTQQGFILSTGISLINSLQHPPKIYFLGFPLWSSIFTSSLSIL